MDSRQVYRGFTIGTAQPSASDMARVRHHLVDFLEPERKYSVGEFCRDVKNILQGNPERNYILVGGTGLYMQTLMLGLPQIPAVPESAREELEKIAQARTGYLRTSRSGCGRCYGRATPAAREGIRCSGRTGMWKSGKATIRSRK